MVTIPLIPPNRGETIVDDKGVPEIRFQNFVEDIATKVDTLSSEIDNLIGSSTIIIEGEYQTLGNNTIICTGVALITLSPTATDGTTVDIKRTNGEVTIESIADIFVNAPTNSVILAREGASVTLIFISETSTWYVT